MRQVIHISDDKIDIIKHLKSQPNMSGYIVSLIERDMENQLITREEIIKLISEHCSNTVDDSLMSSVQVCLDF